MNLREGFTFGVFAGSGAGVDPGSGLIAGPADDTAAIVPALDALSGGLPLLVRAYVHYVGQGRSANVTPVGYERLVTEHRRLSLALCYRCATADVPGWIAFVRRMVREQGHLMAAIQITEEANNPHAATGGDGSFPMVIEALVAGVRAARQEADACGYDIAVGFNVTPSFDPDQTFWHALAGAADGAFYDSLGYVGFDFFPDVFRPLPPGLDIATAVTGLLSQLRQQCMTAKIQPQIPIHISENSWPTNAARTPERQAQVLREVVEAVISQASELHITSYAYFTLRDANSHDDSLRFGLMADDYTPKPAFDVYRQMISKYSSAK